MLYKIRFALFTWCLLASCVVIFPIRCDLSDFTNKELRTLPNTRKMDSHSKEAKNSWSKLPHGQIPP